MFLLYCKNNACRRPYNLHFSLQKYDYDMIYHVSGSFIGNLNKSMINTKNRLFTFIFNLQKENIVRTVRLNISFKTICVPS